MGGSLSRDLRVWVPVSRHADFVGLIDRERGWRSCSWVKTERKDMLFAITEAHVDFEAELRKALFKVEATKDGDPDGRRRTD